MLYIFWCALLRPGQPPGRGLRLPIGHGMMLLESGHSTEWVFARGNFPCRTSMAKMKWGWMDSLLTDWVECLAEEG